MGIGLNKKVFTVIIFSLAFILNAYSQTETFSAGSFIINMGVTPQTYSNGLKPYGMVYDLVKNYRTPVKWIIDTTKSKDGIDFNHNGTSYRGGTFLIPVNLITPTILGRIAYWQGRGVIGATSIGPITAYVFKTITIAPSWTLDKANGSIAVRYFTNAEIPATAHGGSSAAGWKTPAELNACDDIFVMPHADPTWNTHKNLYYWNKDWQGNIWAGCHAVSVLESLEDPVLPIKMNFLSTNGLILFSNHSNASPPYTYEINGDPVMQFMSTMDGAANNGSERVFLPLLSSSWRNSVKIGVHDRTQADMPGNSAGPAGISLYGRAFDDTTRGYVMYQAGHNLENGTVPERVAAQRAFFNYSFFANSLKSAVDVTIDPLPAVVRYGDTLTLDFSVPPEIDLRLFSISWSSTCGGIFLPNNTTKRVRFVTPTDSSIRSCNISISLTDTCSRQHINTVTSFLITGVLQFSMSELNVFKNASTNKLKWSGTNELNLKYYSIERSYDGINFNSIKLVYPAGNHSNKNQYEFSDNSQPLTLIFYRISALDFTGRITYSNTVSLKTEGDEFELKILPNIIHDQITRIMIYTKKKQLVMAQLMDISGRHLSSRSYQINPGQNIFEFDEVVNLSPGIYYLRIFADGSTYFKEFYKN